MRAALLLLLLGGCELIASIPTASTQNGDARIDDLDGDASTPVDMGMACIDNTTCTSPASPICGMPEGACRECVVDSECPTNVCMPDGTCASDARFLYVAPAGNGVDCTLAAPCSLDSGVAQLTPAKDIVKLAPGLYQRTTQLTITISGTLAGPGATIRVLDGATITGIVTSGDITTTLLGLTLDVRSTNSAVQCFATGGLRYHRVTVMGGDTGTYAMGCPFTMTRSRLSGSMYYALYVRLAPVEITNSYIVNNVTNTTYMAAAVVLDQVTGRIAHSTLAYNTPGLDGALSCAASPAFVVQNIVATQNTSTGISATCTVTNSIVDAAYTGGANNLAVDPLFVAPVSGNYHLQPTSPARGIGDPAVMVGGRDSDGEARPQPAGTNADSGADETP